MPWIKALTSVDPAAGGDGRIHEEHLHIVLGAVGGKDHAVAYFAAELGGLQVGDQDDLFANQIFGGVPLGDAG